MRDAIAQFAFSAHSFLVPSPWFSSLFVCWRQDSKRERPANPGPRSLARDQVLELLCGPRLDFVKHASQKNFAQRGQFRPCRTAAGHATPVNWVRCGLSQR